MTWTPTLPSRRRFLRDAAGFAAMASTIGASRSSAAVERAGQAPRLRIRAVVLRPRVFLDT